MFDPSYEVILADTEAARAIHRKIRYHVYCLEPVSYTHLDVYKRQV